MDESGHKPSVDINYTIYKRAGTPYNSPLMVKDDYLYACYLFFRLRENREIVRKGGINDPYDRDARISLNKVW